MCKCREEQDALERPRPVLFIRKTARPAGGKKMHHKAPAQREREKKLQPISKSIFVFSYSCHRERRRRVAISNSLIKGSMRLLHFVRNDSLSVIRSAFFNFEIGSNIACFI
jgi:hypothetical protein